MKYILDRLEFCKVNYEKITDNALRVFGNFKGFSSVRAAHEGWVEVDGKLMDYEDFENWLCSIKL